MYQISETQQQQLAFLSSPPPSFCTSIFCGLQHLLPDCSSVHPEGKPASGGYRCRPDTSLTCSVEADLSPSPISKDLGHAAPPESMPLGHSDDALSGRAPRQCRTQLWWTVLSVAKATMWRSTWPTTLQIREPRASQNLKSFQTKMTRDLCCN